MERKFDNQLEEIKNILLEMGGLVEKALHLAIEGYFKKDFDLLNSVKQVEFRVNELQVKIDNLCLNLLASQGPVATDLRVILSIIKINTDLERMGDQSMNISYLARDILKRNYVVAEVSELSEMAYYVRDMVKKALDCFVRRDAHAAESVLKMDDKVDELKTQITQKQIDMIKSNASLTESCLDIIQIARNLERLGDHSTNIAEDVIFAYTGKDIRHGAN